MSNRRSDDDEAADSAAMTRVRDGEVERLGDLFERHHRRLFTFFVRLVGDRSRAEDLVQEVFVRMLKYRRSFRPGSAFVPWMYALARNAATDHWRALPKEQQEPEGLPEPVAREVPPLESLAAEEERTQLHRALARLPEDKRELLLLARSGELRYEGIGELLGCSVAAVKVRVHRAMKLLRTAYFEVGEERGTA